MVVMRVGGETRGMICQPTGRVSGEEIVGMEIAWGDEGTTGSIGPDRITEGMLGGLPVEYVLG
jgi:hypothetical protein